MKRSIVLNLFLLIVISFSCQDVAQLTETQRHAIIEDIRGMAIKFFMELDSGRIDEAMTHLDSSAVFYYISFYGLEISPDDIAEAYNNVTSLKSKWNFIEIDPLTVDLAYYQASFNQVATDSLGKASTGQGYVSAIVTLRDNNWKFLKGQIYTEKMDKE